MKRLIATAIFLSGAALAAPAAAQDAGGDRVNQLIVYGDDPCPVSTGEEITVCARKAESERYRIPEALRGAESPANVAWTQRVQEYEWVGKTGVNSCSPVGPGGELGCTRKLIQAAYAEREGGADVRFGQLIEEERARRLSTIDDEAAEQQVLVEEAEREYAERQAAREAAGSGAEPVDPNAAPMPLLAPDAEPGE